MCKGDSESTQCTHGPRRLATARTVSPWTLPRRIGQRHRQTQSHTFLAWYVNFSRWFWCVMSYLYYPVVIALKFAKSWLHSVWLVSVGIDLKELGGWFRSRNVLNSAQGLKFKADFHLQMSVRRHELGVGVQPPGNSNPEVNGTSVFRVGFISYLVGYYHKRLRRGDCSYASLFVCAQNFQNNSTMWPQQRRVLGL